MCLFSCLGKSTSVMIPPFAIPPSFCTFSWLWYRGKGLASPYMHIDNCALMQLLHRERQWFFFQNKCGLVHHSLYIHVRSYASPYFPKLDYRSRGMYASAINSWAILFKNVCIVFNAIYFPIIHETVSDNLLILLIV